VRFLIDNALSPGVAKEHPGAELGSQIAAGYGGCQVLTEAVKRAGSLDREKVRAAILKPGVNTVYGRFKASGGPRRGLPAGDQRLLHDPGQSPGGQPRRAGRRHAL